MPRAVKWRRRNSKPRGNRQHKRTPTLTRTSTPKCTPRHRRLKRSRVRHRGHRHRRGRKVRSRERGSRGSRAKRNSRNSPRKLCRHTHSTRSTTHSNTGGRPCRKRVWVLQTTLGERGSGAGLALARDWWAGRLAGYVVKAGLWDGDSLGCDETYQQADLDNQQQLNGLTCVCLVAHELEGLVPRGSDRRPGQDEGSTGNRHSTTAVLTTPHTGYTKGLFELLRKLWLLSLLLLSKGVGDEDRPPDKWAVGRRPKSRGLRRRRTKAVGLVPLWQLRILTSKGWELCYVKVA